MVTAVQSVDRGGRAGESSLAVVICTRDRTASLLQTLDTIWRQLRLPNELLIIDDGQLDIEHRTEIAKKCQQFSIAYVYHRKDSPGLTVSRNVAARLAASDVLVYLDDDVSCEVDFLSEVGRLMRDPRVAGVTAAVGEPAFATMSARIYQWGYRVAGWWGVRPKGGPPGPPPACLSNPDVAVPARWLSGAAMALRREVVLEHPFDESLAGYGLGEDREMGYRLAPHYWLIEAKRAHVVHRRKESARSDHRHLGFMTANNYLYILAKNCRMNAGDWVATIWSLTVLVLMHVAWGMAGRKRAHFAEVRGMIDGAVAFGLARWGLRSKPAFESSRCDAHGRIRSVGTSALHWPARTAVPDRPIRVAFVTNRLVPGGAESMLVSLVGQLPGHSVKPLVFCLKEAGPLAPACRAQGISVFDHLLPFKSDAAVIGRLRDLFNEHHVDVVTVAHSGGDRMFWATLAAGVSRTPVVVWSHWFPSPDMHHFERANRMLFRFVDSFVALGDRHRFALIRHEQVPAGRITVIRNGIDVDRFRPQSWSAARRKLRLSPQHISVGIVANLRYEKRHDVFIEAARRLAGSNPNLRFFMIGDGPQRDAVHAAASASGLDHETLRFLGHREDLPDILPGLDISCLCSDIECFSVSMLEAAAAGCAFIGPKVGCLPEFLVDGITGLLIRPGNTNDLANAIARLAGDASLRHQLVEGARDRLEPTYALDTMAGCFADLFHGLVRTSRRPSHDVGDSTIVVTGPVRESAASATAV